MLTKVNVADLLLVKVCHPKKNSRMHPHPYSKLCVQLIYSSGCVHRHCKGDFATAKLNYLKF